MIVTCAVCECTQAVTRNQLRDEDRKRVRAVRQLERLGWHATFVGGEEIWLCPDHAPIKVAQP